MSTVDTIGKAIYLVRTLVIGNSMGISSESSNLGSPVSGTGGVFVTCTDLTYKVRVKGRWRARWKTILHGIDAYLMPREMTVIMGPSGSGES